MTNTFGEADINALEELLDTEQKVFLGGNDIGWPAIQDITPAKHCGYGVFTAKTDDYDVSFDGGNGMSRLPSGKGYTVMQVRSGEYPYDFEAVRAILDHIKASL